MRGEGGVRGPCRSVSGTPSTGRARVRVPERTAYHAAPRRPSVPALSRRLARLAFAGMLTWAALLAVPLAVTPGVETEVLRLVLLAPLALVPLFLAASVPAQAPSRSLEVASWLLLPGMAGAAASAVVPSGVGASALAGLWLLAAASVGVWALGQGVRQWRGGTLDAAEGAVALGWAALPVGALWLVLARAGVDTGYSSLVALLTAAHLHVAGAFGLIWAGLLGRTLAPGWQRPHAVLTVGLAAGVGLVAAGIALGRGPAGGSGVEAVGVAVLTASAAGLGAMGVVRAGAFQDRVGGLMVAVSGGALVFAMGRAAWFQFGTRLGIGSPDVAWMASHHGALNAYGFALWGALGWRRLKGS